MAKRKGRKRGFSLRRVRVSPELVLSTLGSEIVITTGMSGGTTTNAMRVMSMRNTFQLVGMTAGEGPITVGYAHSDYTVTEIKECLESNLSLNAGDRISKEKSDRLVRIVGTLSAEMPRLNDGRPVRTKLNWFFPVGQKLNLFAYNEDNTNALTTGTVVHSVGDMWVKDSV